MSKQATVDEEPQPQPQPEEGWFGQPKYSTFLKKVILRCIGFALIISIKTMTEKLFPLRSAKGSDYIIRFDVAAILNSWIFPKLQKLG